MKNILLRARKGPFEVYPPAEALRRGTLAGGVGGLLVSNAVHRMLAAPGVTVTPDRCRPGPADADRINERYDAFVLPLPAAFRVGWEHQLGRLTDLIERLDMPVVVLGVAARTGLDGDLAALAPIDEHVKRFAAAVLERSASIGVCGELTARYLEHLGFRDVDVVGCPSVFLHSDRLAVDKPGPALDPATARVALNLAGAPPELAGLAARLGERYPELVYVAEDRAGLELMLWGDPPDGTGPGAPPVAAPAGTADPLYRDGRMVAFTDPPPWISYLGDRDLTVGTRVHTAVAAVLAGRPGYLLATDSRGLELARYLEVPHRPVTGADAGVELTELYAEADYAGLVSGHRDRLDTLVRFCDKHGLPHVLGGDGTTASATGSTTGSALASATPFDDQVSETRYPDSPRTLATAGAADLGHRLRWLRDRNVALGQRVGSLARTVRALEAERKRSRRRIAVLEAQAAGVELLAKRVGRLEARFEQPQPSGRGGRIPGARITGGGPVGGHGAGYRLANGGWRGVRSRAGRAARAAAGSAVGRSAAGRAVVSRTAAVRRSWLRSGRRR